MLGLQTAIKQKRREAEEQLHDAQHHNQPDTVRYLNGVLAGIDFALGEVEKAVHKIKEITNAVE